MNSFTHTKYSNLSDDEFLGMIESKRQHSPVIDELCKRLEQKPEVLEIKDRHLECPVCESSLSLDYDPGNDFLNLVISVHN